MATDKIYVIGGTAVPTHATGGLTFRLNMSKKT
jgi:hypothetical protein